MGTKRIFIYATKSNPHPPIIFDSEGNIGQSSNSDEALTTMVNNGDTVIWKVAHNCDIEEIKRFDMTTNNIMSTPSPDNNDKKKWSGTVNYKSGDDVETYSITYVVGGKEYKEDPKLQMHQSN